MTDFLATLATESKILQKQYRKEISDMFYSDYFFLMNERTLRKWQFIMRDFMAFTNDVFDELFKKFASAESLFYSKAYENKQKTLFYKRLGFLVYSSEINGIEEGLLDTLLKKMTEGFKNSQKDSEMKAILLMLSRILMLRLSTLNLAEAMRKLWPHLLNEMVSVFDRGDEYSMLEDYKLAIEGVKLIELMS